MKIHFAHQTFKWTNEARGKAAVHCVIIGFGPQEVPVKRLFEYASVTDAQPHEINPENITPYLTGGPTVLLANRPRPLCSVPTMHYGSKPTDGGHLILSDEERKEFLAAEPAAAPFIRPYIGAEEFINGKSRWCLWLVDMQPSELKQLPLVRVRVEAVRRFREASKAATTRGYKNHTLFRQLGQPTTNYLLVPSFSTSARYYVPIGFLTPDVIASNKVFTLPNATLYHFGVLTSAMHMAWMRYTCGRLKSDYGYSKDIVYNNFPWPAEPSAADRQAIEAAAQAVLDARAAHPGSTLADLYDPLAMLPDLRAAHRHLDRLVDRLYLRRPFHHDTERVQRLFEKYAELSAPLAPAATSAARSRPRRVGK